MTITVHPPEMSEGYEKPGLYLLFPDGKKLELTAKNIRETVDRYLNDPSLLPDSVKEAVDYAPCSICPRKDTAEICHAIMPTFPFMDVIEQFRSYDRVVALYREKRGSVLHTRETTMQQALIFISILSLTEYCEVGLTYKPYFKGVNPLQSAEVIADKVFQNMVEIHDGDLNHIEQITRKMDEEFLETATCQVKRLRLISKNDVFTNAFVNTQTTSGWLLMKVEEKIDAKRKEIDSDLTYVSDHRRV